LPHPGPLDPVKQLEFFGLIAQHQNPTNLHTTPAISSSLVRGPFKNPDMTRFQQPNPSWPGVYARFGITVVMIGMALGGMGRGTLRMQ